MEPSTKRHLRRSGPARTMVAALALATALGGMSTAVARADDRGHEDRGHEDRGHEDRGHQDRQSRDQRGHRQQHEVRQHFSYAYERPHNYYRAPPPVDYYQPPQPPPAIDFVFPLHLR